jgi:hypothetical protein
MARTTLERITRAGIVAISVIGVGVLGAAVTGRFLHPWPLEWMEGAVLHHALRLLQGKPIYGPPTAEFIPYLYPPLSYLPIAGSAALFGPSLPAARLPSLLSIAGTLFFIGRLSYRTCGVRSAGWLAAGLFALGYGYAGAFLDLARVDAFFLLLATAGAERLQAGRYRPALLLLALCCFAKQQGFLFLAAAVAFLPYAHGRRHLRDLAVAVVGTAAMFVVAHIATNGWMTTYVFALPFGHGVIWRQLPGFLLYDLVIPLPVMATMATVTVWRRRRSLLPLDAMLAAGLLSSALGRAHIGGHENVLLPALAMLAAATSAYAVPIMTSPARTSRLRVALGASLLLQSAILVQSPAHHWPSAESTTRFRAVSDALRKCAGAGDAVSLDHALLMGRPYLHTMALSDLMAGRDSRLADTGMEALLNSLEAPGAPEALGLGARFGALDEVVASRYKKCAAPDRIPMTTGYQPPRMIVYRRIVDGKPTFKSADVHP